MVIGHDTCANECNTYVLKQQWLELKRLIFDVMLKKKEIFEDSVNWWENLNSSSCRSMERLCDSERRKPSHCCEIFIKHSLRRIAETLILWNRWL